MGKVGVVGRGLKSAGVVNRGLKSAGKGEGSAEICSQ